MMMPLRYSSLPHRRFDWRIKLLPGLLGGCFTLSAIANPVGPQVVSGAASIAQSGSTLTVTNSNGAILNWQQFNIGAGETTRFIQPSASSAVMNRVLASDPSLIYGTLSSNGKVWLVNPAGILVGPGATINVASFVASTLNISNQDFLAGRLNAIATPGAGNLVNQGRITTPSGGSVYLIGANVSNEGLITTPQGDTILAAGNSVQLLDTGTPGVKVEISGSEGNATNLGQIVAEAGRIGIAGVLVRNSGQLNASSAVAEGGRIFLRASKDAYVDGAGRIVTTGTQGGRVEVLGDRVAVTDQASIDASGRQGGGTILVGGDYQGKNPEVPNASVTYFGADASLKADATDNGNGGKVVVWADDTTRALGSISARGGANGGDGGLVETSGHKLLFVGDAHIDASSPKGKAGTWLLDPAEIEISHLTGGTITDTTLNATLNGGTDVSLQTSGSGQGDISVMSGVAISNTSGGARAITLTAHTNLTLNSGASISGGSGANTLDITLIGDYSGSGGILTLDSNTTLSGKSVTLKAADIAIDTSASPATISATSNVMIGRSGSSGTIKLGGSVGGVLSLSDDELHRFATPTLQVGLSSASDTATIVYSALGSSSALPYNLQLGGASVSLSATSNLGSHWLTVYSDSLADMSGAITAASANFYPVSANRVVSIENDCSNISALCLVSSQLANLGVGSVVLGSGTSKGVTINDNADFSGKNVTLQSSQSQDTELISLASGKTLSTANLDINSSGFASPVEINGQINASGAVTIYGKGNSTYYGGIAASSGGIALTTSGKDLNLTGTAYAGSNSNAIYIGSGETLTTTGSGAIKIKGSSDGTGKGLYLSPDSPITIGGASQSGAIQFTADRIAAGGTVTIQTSGAISVAPLTTSLTNWYVGAIDGSTAGDVNNTFLNSLTGYQTLTLGSAALTGALNLPLYGLGTGNTLASYGGGVTLTSGGTISGTGNLDTSPSTSGNGGAITVNAAGAVTLGNLNATGKGAGNSGGAIQVSSSDGNISLGNLILGNTTATATGGNATLNITAPTANRSVSTGTLYSYQGGNQVAGNLTINFSGSSGGTISMPNGASRSGNSANTVSGKVTVTTSAGDITLNEVALNDQYDLDVTANSGKILAGAPVTAGHANATSQSIHLTATGGIGASAAPLKVREGFVTLASLHFSNSGTGDVYITSDDALHVDEGYTANGSINLTSTGTYSFGTSLIEFNAGIGNVVANGGNIAYVANKFSTAGSGSYGKTVASGNGQVLTIRPYSYNTVYIDAYGSASRSGGLVITSSDLSNFQVRNLSIGDSTYTSGITVRDTSNGGSGSGLAALWTPTGGSGTLSLTITSGEGGPFTVNAPLRSAGGALTISSPYQVTLSAAGALDTTNAGAAPNGGNITLTSNSYSIASGAAITAGNAGTVYIAPYTSSTALNLGSGTGGALWDQTALNALSGSVVRFGTYGWGGITVGSNVTVPSSVGQFQLWSDNGNSISFSNATLTAASVELNSKGNITGNANGSVAVDTSAANGNISLSLSQNGAFDIGSSASPLVVKPGSGNLNLSTGTVTTTNYGNAALSVDGSFSTSHFSGSTAAGRKLTLAATGSGADLTVNSALSFSGDSVSLSAGHDMIFTSAGSLAAGDVLLTASNALSFSGSGAAVTVSGSGTPLVTNSNSFSNTRGSGVFSLTGSGVPRWLTYASAPASVTKGGLSSSFRHYNGTYAGYAPQSVSESGSGFIYASAPGALSVDTSLSATSHIYGDLPTVSVGYVLSGFADNEDNASSIGLTGTAAFNNVPAQSMHVGSYGISYISGLTSSQGFSLTAGAAGSYSVTPAPLSITANNATRTYDKTAFSGGNGITATGFKNSDNITALSGIVSYSGTAQGAVNAGTYAITPAGLSNTDYSISFVAGSLIISPASLTLSGAAAQNKVYDATATASITGTLTGIYAGDTVALGGNGSFANKNVGNAKAVTGSLTLSGTSSGNYSLVQPTGLTANITAAPLSAALTGSVSKTYDGNTSATLAAGNFVLTGVFAGDTVTPAGSGSFDTRHVGGGKTMTVSSMALGGTDGGNYVLTGGTGSIPSAAIGTISPLASVAWSGGATGNWSTAANWTGGALPDGNNVLSVSIPANKTVTYDAGAGNSSFNTISSAGTVILAGGSVSIGTSFTTSGYQQSAGLLTGTGDLTVGQAFSKSGGTMALSGFVNITQASGNLFVANDVPLKFGSVVASNGNILIDNIGAVTTSGAISAPNGTVTIAAHSPLTIGGPVTASGSISLTAGATAGTGDDLTVNAPVTTTNGGNISLVAGDNLAQNANVVGSGGSVSLSALTGNITMAPSSSTTSGGGSINYAAPSGSMTLGNIAAGAGSIELIAGSTISVLPNSGLTGSAIDVDVGGTFNLSFNGVTFSSPSSTTSSDVQSALQTVVAATQTASTTATTSDTRGSSAPSSTESSSSSSSPTSSDDGGTQSKDKKKDDKTADAKKGSFGDETSEKPASQKKPGSCT